MFLSSLLSDIPGVRHGFGSREHPEPNWPESPIWKQVHGIGIGEVVRPAQALGEVDGLWTRKPGMTVGVRTADCVPILLAKLDGSAVAALHAGWRGSLADISSAFFSTTKQNPSEWAAAIGPCAGPCCYEVSEELASTFARIERAAVRGRYLDLAAFNAARLRALGVQKIDALSLCTVCQRAENGFIFNSFRRDRNSDRQVSSLTLS